MQESREYPPFSHNPHWIGKCFPLWKKRGYSLSRSTCYDQQNETKQSESLDQDAGAGWRILGVPMRYPRDGLTLDLRARQLHDEVKSGGSDPRISELTTVVDCSSYLDPKACNEKGERKM